MARIGLTWDINTRRKGSVCWKEQSARSIEEHLSMGSLKVRVWLCIYKHSIRHLTYLAYHSVLMDTRSKWFSSIMIAVDKSSRTGQRWGEDGDEKMRRWVIGELIVATAVILWWREPSFPPQHRRKWISSDKEIRLWWWEPLINISSCLIGSSNWYKSPKHIPGNPCDWVG